MKWKIKTWKRTRLLRNKGIDQILYIVSMPHKTASAKPGVCWLTFFVSYSMTSLGSKNKRNSAISPILRMHKVNSLCIVEAAMTSSDWIGFLLATNVDFVGHSSVPSASCFETFELVHKEHTKRMKMRCMHACMHECMNAWMHIACAPLSIPHSKFNYEVSIGSKHHSLSATCTTTTALSQLQLNSSNSRSQKQALRDQQTIPISSWKTSELASGRAFLEPKQRPWRHLACTNSAKK